MSIINTLPFNLTNGTTGDASQVMANFNEIFNDVNNNAAGSGNNTDITSLQGRIDGAFPASGKIGELLTLNNPFISSSVTFTNGSANITWPTNTPPVGAVVRFQTTGSLPTNFSTALNYYVISSIGNVIQVSTTFIGAAIVAGSAGSGTQTGGGGAGLLTGVVNNVAVLILSPGDWVCSGAIVFNAGGSTTISTIEAALSTSPSGISGLNGTLLQSSFITGATNIIQTQTLDLSVSISTSLYLNALASFGTSTMVVSGNIRCRRVS